MRASVTLALVMVSHLAFAGGAHRRALSSAAIEFQDPSAVTVRPLPLIDEVTFSVFLREFERFRDTSWLVEVSDRHFFTVDQLERILRLMPFSSDRVMIAKALYGRIADPEHFDRVYLQIPNEFDRRSLALWVSRSL